MISWEERKNSSFVLWVILAGMVSGFLQAVANGQAVDAQGFGWYKVNPIRGTAWGGIPGEVLSRSKRWETQERDLGIVTHETTHYLNSQVRNEIGRRRQQGAAYMPGGYVVLLPYTGMPIRSFARQSRGLIGSMAWSDGTPCDALDLIDEYSAYMCGMAARLEYPNDTSSSPAGDLKRGRMLEADIRTLREACRQRGYPYVHRIDELLAFGSVYFAKLERGMR